MNDATDLNSDEKIRYSRQSVISSFGVTNQTRLKKSSVAVVGLGGLGSPVAMYLAAMGIGNIGLVDDDVVDLSNLARQILFTTNDIGASKAVLASSQLKNLNPNIKTEVIEERIDANNVVNLLKPFDVIVDCADSLETTYLLNDTCLLLGKPFIFGSVFQFEGQVAAFKPNDGPCYRCLFPKSVDGDKNQIENCETAGVLGSVAGTIGTWQATETIKILLDFGSNTDETLSVYDAHSNRINKFKIEKNPDCVGCSPTARPQDLIGYSSDKNQESNVDIPQIMPKDLKQKIDDGDTITILDVREQSEWDISNLAEFGSVHIPKGDVVDRIGELNPDVETVVHCRSGGRSNEIAKALYAAGFSNVSNLDGGLTRWADELDPSMQVG